MSRNLKLFSRKPAYILEDEGEGNVSGSETTRLRRNEY